MDIKWINAEACHDLRSRVLNRNKTRRPGDKTALHLASYLGDRVVGIASFFNQNQQEIEEIGNWRVRGMVVDPEYQGQGIGKALVNFFIDEKSNEIELLWCNARQGAEGFYKSIGFHSLGLVDRAPGIKVYRMIRQ